MIPLALAVVFVGILALGGFAFYLVGQCQKTALKLSRVHRSAVAELARRGLTEWQAQSLVNSWRGE